jgi:hypothetical protein
MSVRGGKYADAAAFIWDTERKDFVKAELQYS